MAGSASFHSTTQKFLDIYDITNDFVVLHDGAIALVLSVSAMNFGLLSEQEQDATIYAYAALLNSLSFPIEIVIRSQPKDVSNYLKLIEQKESETMNPVFRQRIREYRQFVESMVQEQNVLDKKFYISIPFTAVEMGLTTKSVVPGAKNKSLSTFEKNYIIDKAKTNLIPRRDHLIDQLARIGLYSRQLTTQELIQLLYSAYNPESFEGQQVTDTDHYTTPLVQAQIQGDSPMIDPITTPTPITQDPVAQPAVATMPESTVPAPTQAPTSPSAPELAQPQMPTQEAPGLSAPIVPTLTPEQPTVTTPTIQSPTLEMVQPMTPPSVVTSAPIAETPAVQATPAPTPLLVTPTMPVSAPTQAQGITTPAVSTPEPVAPAFTTQPLTEDPQAAINQTLSQIGTPIITPDNPTQS